MAYIEFIIGTALLILTFILTLGLTKLWIGLARKKGLVGKDMNKVNRKKVAESGGMAVIVGFVITLFLYLLAKIFILKTSSHILETLVLILTVFLAGFIGFGDDMLGWKKGMSPWLRFLLTIPVAIPLILIKAGDPMMVIPFFGVINFGIFFPFIILIGFLGATNGVNLLAGYNGLEAGLGVIILTALGIVSFSTGQVWLSLICFAAVIALLGFLVYNKCPAKVFPGDSLTFTIGALIASIAILGNIERAAIILFIPFIIEGFLKLRSNFKAETFGRVNPDNSLDEPYKKIYSLTHLSLRWLKKIKPSHKVYEKNVVWLLIFFEIIIAAIVIIISII